ncbi:MAG: hypothetical protein ACOVQU_09210 [Exiguobacterium acetylicum]
MNQFSIALESIASNMADELANSVRTGGLFHWKVDAVLVEALERGHFRTCPMITQAIATWKEWLESNGAKASGPDAWNDKRHAAKIAAMPPVLDAENSLPDEFRLFPGGLFQAIVGFNKLVRYPDGKFGDYRDWYLAVGCITEIDPSIGDIDSCDLSNVEDESDLVGTFFQPAIPAMRRAQRRALLSLAKYLASEVPDVPKPSPSGKRGPGRPRNETAASLSIEAAFKNRKNDTTIGGSEATKQSIADQLGIDIKEVAKEIAAYVQRQRDAQKKIQKCQKPAAQKKIPKSLP